PTPIPSPTLPHPPHLTFSPRLPHPPTSTLFPYTTLFRSRAGVKPRPRLRKKPGTKSLRVTIISWRPCIGARRNGPTIAMTRPTRSEEHTSELQSPYDLVCSLLLEKKKVAKEVVCLGGEKN